MNKIYCFDIDETLCKSPDLNYENSIPIPERIDIVNRLYDEGYIIKIFTARGSKTKIDWSELTKKQLSAWGLKYHELHFGKPYADYYIDDKAKDVFDWF